MILNDICELIVDCEHKTAPKGLAGYPSIRVPNVGRGRLILEGVNRVDEATYQKWTRRAVPQAGDLIVAREAPLGNVAIVQPGQKVCLGQRTVLVRPCPTKVAPDYLCYFLLGDYVQDRFQSVSTGATVPHLNMSDIRGLSIPELPPILTQQRIAAILSAYDDLIENNTRRIAILEEMARRLYEEWFVHFRFPGHEEAEFVGELPNGWEEVPLGDLVDVKWGDTKTTKKSYVEDGYVAYSAAGPDGFLPHHDYDRTGIVLSAIGANCGITWLARGKWSCIKNTIRLFANNGSVSDEYLFFVTGFSSYWPKRGAAQPFISQGDAKICKVVVPSIDLHNRFLSFARPALEHVDKLRLTNINLRTQRDLLLPKLISGEIDVSEAEARLEAAE